VAVESSRPPDREEVLCVYKYVRLLAGDGRVACERAVIATSRVPFAVEQFWRGRDSHKPLQRMTNDPGIRLPPPAISPRSFLSLSNGKVSSATRRNMEPLELRGECVCTPMEANARAR